MILSYARTLAEEHTQLKVTGAVITIPPYFNQFERQAILDAAAIADLNVLSLIHDSTAVGFYFGARQSFPTPEKHIFFDMGAGSTVASLISFSQNKKMKKLQVKHVAYDDSFGGHFIDALLVSFLEKKFNEKYPDLSFKAEDHPYSYKLLLQEAIKLKEALSLNLEVQVKLDSLFQQRGLHFTLLRTDIETLLMPYKTRCVQLLAQILESDPDLGQEKNPLKSLVLVGGSTRIPLIQSWIGEVIGKDKIATNVNSDEAPSLGAVLYAAKLSPGYRVTHLDIEDSLPYSIHMGKSVVFQSNKDLFPQTKSVTLKKTSMQSFRLYTRDDLVLADTTFGPFNESVTQSNIKLSLNANGLLSLTNATQLVETSSFFGSKSNSSNPLDYNITFHVPPMSTEEIMKAKQKLSQWKVKEDAIRYRAKLLNDFISLVYEIRSKLSDEVLQKLSTEEERSKLLSLRNEKVEWIEDHEESATLEQIQTQLTQLRDLVDPLYTRKEQWDTGIELLQSYGVELNDTSIHQYISELQAQSTYNLTVLQTKKTEVYTKVMEKREQERIRKEKERLAKEEEERKAREKLMEDIKKKLEADKLAKEKAANETTSEQNKLNNTTATEFNETQSDLPTKQDKDTPIKDSDSQKEEEEDALKQKMTSGDSNEDDVPPLEEPPREEL